MMPSPRSGHVIVAPDKFRGSLTAAQASAALARGIRAARPAVSVAGHPVADGGEGTVQACLRAGFSRVRATVTGPDGRPLTADYARHGGTAVIEFAAAAGLSRLPPGASAARTATSRGVGELIRHALDRGAARIVLGIGGSATTDGGAGIVRALGARLDDAAGGPLPDGGAALTGAARLDLAGLDPRLTGTELLVACDVDNPLLGPRGAATVYGPQKGAGPADVAVLEAGLTRWADLVAGTSGAGLPGAGARHMPGAGAAGGAGFGLAAVLGARLVPGTGLLLDITGFAAALPGAALVVTGEGSLDEQSLHGKAPVGVARAAAAAGVPTVAVAGRCTISPARARQAGLAGVYALTMLEPDLARCQSEAAPLLERLAARVAGDWLPAVARTAPPDSRTHGAPPHTPDSRTHGGPPHTPDSRTHGQREE